MREFKQQELATEAAAGIVFVGLMAATGFFSAFGTGIAMKTDIVWIK